METKKLKKIRASSPTQPVCALRFMDMNRYNRVNRVSSQLKFQPR